jgi:hypothetical protein
MLEYELLKVKNTPLKHWIDSSGWQIAKAMHDVVLSKTIFMISKVNFVTANAANADEVTTIDA